MRGLPYPASASTPTRARIVAPPWYATITIGTREIPVNTCQSKVSSGMAALSIGGFSLGVFPNQDAVIGLIKAAVDQSSLRCGRTARHSDSRQGPPPDGALQVTGTFTAGPLGPARAWCSGRSRWPHRAAGGPRLSSTSSGTVKPPSGCRRHGRLATCSARSPPSSWSFYS